MNATSNPGVTPSTPTSATIQIPTTQAITVQLPPKSQDDRYLGLEPAMWVPIATIITLVVTSGVQIWNTNRQLRQARQITHDELEQARASAKDEQHHAERRARDDRIMQARRDIYVEIMADYQKVQQFIGSLASSEAKFEDRALLSVMSASVNKLWIWGEVDSAYKVREFYTQVNEFYYVALAKAQVIQELRSSIAAFTKQLRKFEGDTARLGDELRALRSEPEVARKAPDWLNREASVANEQRQSMRLEHDWVKVINELDEKLRHKNAEYVNFIVERQANLNFYINGVMASARADVGLGGDLSALNAQTQEMGDRVRAALHQRNRVYEAERREVFDDDADSDY